MKAKEAKKSELCFEYWEFLFFNIWINHRRISFILLRTAACDDRRVDIEFRSTIEGPVSFYNRF